MKRYEDFEEWYEGKRLQIIQQKTAKALTKIPGATELPEASLPATFRIVVPKTHLEIDEWVKSHETHPLGFDCEWSPQIGRSDQAAEVSQLAVMSLSCARSCLVIHLPQLVDDHIPPSLTRLLETSSQLYTVNPANDLIKLAELGQVPKQLINVGSEARRKGYTSHLPTLGLQWLTTRVLGKHLEEQPHLTMSRWDKPQLTEEQTRYAALDSWLCYQLAQTLGLCTATTCGCADGANQRNVKPKL
mmetsp:Transcript_14087/g.33278  ORF Transcript_14087/g.33278 Transcript_14087/m.33278 type:complete len:245 (-) Transcript_14087:50-784(-)